MSHLNTVLRRSIVHLDPADGEGRRLALQGARESLVRMLGHFNPPLSAEAVERKLLEFDDIVAVLEAEFEIAQSATPPLSHFQPPSGGDSAMPDIGTSPAAALDLPPEQPVDEADAVLEPEDEALYDDDYEPYVPYEPDEAEEDQPKGGFADWVDRNGIHVLSRLIFLVVLLAALAIGGVYVNAHMNKAATPVAETIAPKATEPEPAPATPVAVAVTPTTPAPPATPAVDPTPPAAPPTAVPVGALALETLVLFDGRDPSLFQSAPDNPVQFRGDAEGGFAEVSSAPGSTGARVLVGRGVYERIAGRTIRIVVVARAAKDAPATGLRFAYQNGRNLSPWTEAALGPNYAPLSSVWAAPKQRGGPESDALILEPGIPGDSTAVDIRSVRIEILQ